MSHQLNLNRLAAVANALGELNDEVVYVGGATVSLYVPVEQTEQTRPTDDVDIVIELASYGDYSRLLGRLTGKGFTQSPIDEVICRFRLRGFIVDIMSTRDIGLGSPNRWYADGFQVSTGYLVRPDVQIRILPPAYFLATKLEAYFSRGQQDPYASKDLEDIIFLIDNCPTLLESIGSADQTLQVYLANSVRRLHQNQNLADVILGHLNGRHQAERTQRILTIIDDLRSV